MEKVILMPSQLDYNKSSYVLLSQIQNTIIDCEEDTIILNFKDCKFCHAIFMSFIGSLFVWAECFGKKLKYRIPTTGSFSDYFKKSGLYSYMTGDTTDYTNSNTIPFHEVSMDDSDIISYIDNILRLAPITLSDKAQESLFKNIYEIFINSIEHSGASHGVYACGHWFPTKKELVFSVYDTGMGIPTKIRKSVDPYISSKDAIIWALEKGNSTKQLDNGTPRGVGLYDFHEFIHLNHGVFSIVSNDICYLFDTNTSYIPLDKPFIGTMVSFIIRNDEEHIYISR